LRKKERGEAQAAWIGGNLEEDWRKFRRGKRLRFALEM
jgi:hypothetical protein